MNEAAAAEYRGPIAIDLPEVDDEMRPASQMRVKLDPEALKEYAHVLADMPPIKLMWDRKEQKYWVVDGAHTLTVFAATGQQVIQALVADGRYLDAWRAAVRENQKRGVRITPADRRARTERACDILPGLVKDWPWSVARLARHCGIDDHTAKPILDQALRRQGIDPGGRRTGIDGKNYPASQPSSNGDQPSGTIADPRNSEGAPAAMAQSASTGPVASNAPATRPSSYRALEKCLDEIRILVGSINAPDDPIRQGWGGFPAVWARLSSWERTNVANELTDLVESLQAWQATIGGRDES
jgi:hypothetical protein